MANEFVIKNGLISKGNGQFTGSVTATNFMGDFTGSLRGSASYSLTASYALNSTAGGSVSSSWASSSISSSYSLTSSYSNIGTGTNNYFPIWSSNRLTATSSLYQSASAICIGTTTPSGLLTAYQMKVQDYISESRYGITSINKISMQTGTGNHTGSVLRGFTSIVGENWGVGATGSGIYIAPFINQYQTLGQYFGVYIDDILWDTTGAGAVSSDYYGIYQKSSTPKNYFAGNVGIGYSGSEYKLRIHDPTQAIKLVLGPNYLDGNTDSALQVIQVNQSASNYAGIYLVKMGNCGGYLVCNNNGIQIGDSTTSTTPYIYCGVASTYSNRVGIGTIAPLQKLDVSGSINIPNTIDTSTGIIYKANTRFIHNYQAPGTDGNFNTFVGIAAGNTTMAKDTQTYQACYNTAIGFSALQALTTGHQNTAVGFYSLLYNNSGFQNVAIGHNTLQQNTVGYSNVALGHNAMLSNGGGYSNIAIGQSALYTNTSGYGNIAIGVGASYLHKTGYSNIAIGSDSQRENVGAIRNVSLGAASLYANTGSYNTSIGDTSLRFNTIGALNTSVGVESGYYNSSGSQNVFVGAWAGYNPFNNIDQYKITADTNMVLIGAGATKNNASIITNGIAIGFGALVAASNQVVLGNTDITSTHIRGNTYHNNTVWVNAPTSQSSTFVDGHYGGVWGHQLSHYNGTPYFYQRNSSSWDIVNQISTNGVTYFNGTGKVGIGTTAPGKLLHVQGEISCSNLIGTVATASYVANVSVPNYTSLNIITASTGTIPIDLSIQEHILYLTASTNISFSLVSGSTSGKVQDTNVYFKNTSGANVAVYFPPTWINLGGVWTNTISANKSGILVLRSIDNSIVVGTYNTQI